MNFPSSNGLRDGIYLGPVEGEGDPFAAYIFDVETRRVRTRSINREKHQIKRHIISTTNRGWYQMEKWCIRCRITFSFTKNTNTNTNTRKRKQ